MGLAPEFVEVLGTLPTYVTGSSFIITPVVALVHPPFALQIDGGPEVAGFVERAQFEDIVLELVEQRGGFAVAEQVDTTVAER